MANNYGYKKLFNELFSEEYKDLLVESKVLFCLIVDRIILSIDNNFIDKKGRYYVIFTNNEICKKLRCSHTKATKILRELEANNLIFRQKRGQGRADLIYLTAVGWKIIDMGNGKNKNKFEIVEKEVKNQIEYDILVEQNNDETINDFVNLITEIYLSKDDFIFIGKRRITTNFVKYRFQKLSAQNIQDVIESIEKNDKPIKNMRSYLISCLYNSIDTAAIADYI